MEAERSRDNGWAPSSWGFPHFVAVLFAIIVLLTLFWLFSSSPDHPECSRLSTFLGICPTTGQGPIVGTPPAQAVTECRRQLDANLLNIPAKTQHERTLVDLRSSPPKNPVYFYIEILKRSYGTTFGSNIASLTNVGVLVSRQNDRDHLHSFETPCFPLQDSSIKSTDGSGNQDKRWVAFCDLTRFQNERQEAETGVLKYRVTIQNWSDERLDYCFVASCDARYPAGRRCDIPPPGQSQGQTASYSPP